MPSGSKTGRGGKRVRPGKGFTYLGMMLVLAIMGFLMALAAQVWQTTLQREKEQELLFAGSQIEQAIGRYYEQSPGGVRQYPRSLEQLLLDSRFPGVKRHLRKIYRDPMSDSAQWGLVLSEEGGIQGVYSLSTLFPLKQAGFDAEHQEFEKRREYTEWKFVYVPSSQALPESGENPEDDEAVEGDAASE